VMSVAGQTRTTRKRVTDDVLQAFVMHNYSYSIIHYELTRRNTRTQPHTLQVLVNKYLLLWHGFIVLKFTDLHRAC